MPTLPLMILALLAAGCDADRPTTGQSPAERPSLLTSPSGPGASRTTVGEMLEPARAGAPAASPAQPPRGADSLRADARYPDRMQDPALFTLAVLAILGTPGPTNTLLATAGATAGVRRSLPLIAAEAAGYSIAILSLGLALGPMLARLPLLAGALRLAVGLYLLRLAVRLWRHGAARLATGAVVTPRQVFVTTLLNPKAIVFALGVLPFGAGPEVWPPYMLGFLLLLVSVALAWIAAGAMLGEAAGRRGWGGAVPRVGAAAVGSFAILMLVSPLLR